MKTHQNRITLKRRCILQNPSPRKPPKKPALIQPLIAEKKRVSNSTIITMPKILHENPLPALRVQDRQMRLPLRDPILIEFANPITFHSQIILLVINIRQLLTIAATTVLRRIVDEGDYALVLAARRGGCG